MASRIMRSYRPMAYVQWIDHHSSSDLREYKLAVFLNSRLVMATPKVFHVVHFTDEKKYDFVSSRWLASDDTCYWPKGVSDRKIAKLRSRHAIPTPCWTLHKVSTISIKGLSGLILYMSNHKSLKHLSIL